MHQYLSYGHCIHSEVRLHHLTTGEGEPTIFVRTTSLPQSTADLPDDCRELFTSPDEATAVYQAGEEIYWLFDTIGSVRITSGETIEIDPAAQSPANGAERLVLGAGLRTVFFQRNNPVFHASAVGIGGDAVMFIGASGAGKSTTAAALAAAGYPVLADDVTPLWTTADGYVTHPGTNAVRIAHQDVQRLRKGIKQPQSDETGSDRQYVASQPEPQKDEYPVCCAYILEWAETLAIDTPAPSEAVSTVLRASHPLYSETDTSAFVDHFQRSLAFIDSVDIRRLSRPKSIEHLDQVVSAIKTDVDIEQGH